MKIEHTPQHHSPSSSSLEGPKRTNYLGRRVKALALAGIVGVVALSNLPGAEGLGGPGTAALPVCLAGCVALSAGSGPWGLLVWMACKSTCIAISLLG